MRVRVFGVPAYDFFVFIALYVCVFVLFGWRIDMPAGLIFDEVHYVPAGQQFFSHENWIETLHAPFAKWLIGLSSSVLGDTPLGWRLPSLVLGSLVIPCVYALMRVFDIKPHYAALAAVLTALNQTIMVQSRTAMLDMHFIGYFVVSVTLLAWSAKRRRSRAGASFGLVLSGVFLGLSAGAKVLGGMNMMLVWGGLMIWRFTEASPKGIFLPRFFSSGFAGWSQFSFVGSAFRQGIPAILVYLLCFLPFLYMEGDWTILSVHQKMLESGSVHPFDHPFASQWWEWPLMLEPIWYHFETLTSAPDAAHNIKAAVFYLGNPVVYWGGLLAVLLCLFYGMQRGDGVMLAVSGAYVGFLLLYAVLPRSLFFAYNYEMAALTFGLALAVFTARIAPPNQRALTSIVLLGSSVGLFIYFYPVLVALPFEEADWMKWRWFSFWA